MESYTDFAGIYDEFMEDTPYDQWASFIHEKLKEYSISDGLLLDLGAGTGEMTRRMRDLGFDMIGVDNSTEMLNVARNKEADSEDILYLNQDMREFELYGTVRGIMSVCDCVNYVTDPEDLLTVFKLCNNYLDPKGLLIFDFNTKKKYEMIDDATIADVKDDAAFIWDNFYDEEECINQYDITFFKEDEKGLYRRFDETHIQRGYDLDEIKALIEKSGLKFLDAFDDYRNKKAGRDSERIVVICMEQGK